MRYVNDTERVSALRDRHTRKRGCPREDMTAFRRDVVDWAGFTHAHCRHNVENPKAVNQLSLFLLTNSAQNDFTEALDVHNTAKHEDEGLHASKVLMAKKLTMDKQSNTSTNYIFARLEGYLTRVGSQYKGVAKRAAPT